MCRYLVRPWRVFLGEAKDNQRQSNHGIEHPDCETEEVDQRLDIPREDVEDSQD